MATPSLTVAKRIRAEAKSRKISQAELAEATGIPLRTLSRRMVGRQPFDIDELDAIAAALGIDLDVLIADAA